MTQPVTSLNEAALAGQTAIEENAGFGTLETDRGCLPLLAMDVRARLTGLISQLTVQQTFRNSLDAPLEATYVFPLPDRAAVTSFRMKVADRVIEAELKERSQARQEYAAAIEAGHRAAIAEEERSGTFSLRVGNIPAKEQITVELTLVGPLPVAAGEATFRFPLVVAPRYVPGIPLDGPAVGLGHGPDTDQTPDGSRVTPPVLLPGFPNPVRLSLEVQLAPAGLDVTSSNWAKRIRSSLHSVIADDGPPWTLRLQPEERLNRDFILRFPIATEVLQTTMLLAPATKAQPGTFALTVVPPSVTKDKQPSPRDLVFLLDRSGSMGGWKMVAARRAVGRMIDSLLEQDQFTVIAFDDNVEYPSHAQSGLAAATDRNRWQTLEWLGKIDARGGTEMGPALQEAVELLASTDADRQRIIVLVTDGQVAGEDMILNQVKKSAGHTMPRVHAVGIDQAVNAGFIQRLADASGGTCTLVESEDRLDSALDHIHQTIATPVVTQVRLEPIGLVLVPDSFAPARLPDIFPDRPVTVFGRFTGDLASARLLLHGLDETGRELRQEVVGISGPTDVLLNLWGRARVRDLEDRYATRETSDPEAQARQIVEVSLATHVLSRFTAYVAVDCAEVVNKGGQVQKIIQPVEMPAGWDMRSVQPCMIPAPSIGRSGQAWYCTSCPDASIDTDIQRAIPHARKAKLRRISHPMLLSSALVRLITDAQEAIKELEGNFNALSGAHFEQLKRLVLLLAEIAVALFREKNAATTAIEALARRGWRIQAYLATANLSSVDLTAVKEYLDEVVVILDGLSGRPTPAGEREIFWR